MLLTNLSPGWAVLPTFQLTLRCTRSPIIYGDQTLVVRKFFLERLGGFPDQPILEDVTFEEKLLGLKMLVLLSPPVVTDARKFLQMGVWQSFVRLLLILPYLPRVFF